MIPTLASQKHDLTKISRFIGMQIDFNSIVRNIIHLSISIVICFQI